jgi:PAS domain S-box-containing protein
MTSTTDTRRKLRAPVAVGRVPTDLDAAGDPYQDLFDFAPVGYLTLDARGTITRVNVTGAALLGGTQRGLCGRRFLRYVRGEDVERWTQLLSRVQRTGEIQSCDLALRRADGSDFEGNLVCRLRSGRESEPSVRMALTDVSSRKRLEDSLRETRARLARAVEGSTDGFWEVEVPSGRATFSRRWGAMLGLDPASLEPCPATWLCRIHPDDLVAFQSAFAAHLRGDTDRFEIEYRARHTDGRWVWVLGRGKVVDRDDEGAPILVAGTTTDVTRRKEVEGAHRLAEDALAASEEHFRTLLKNLPVPVAFASASQEVAYVNDEFTRVLGYSREEIPTVEAWYGRAYPDPIYRAWVEEVWSAAVRDAARQGKPVPPTQFLVTCKGGEVRTMLLSAFPLGRSLLVTLVDISEERALQAKLALASRMAALGTLVAGVAHEMNNPLAAEIADEGVAIEICLEIRDRIQGSTPVDWQAEVRALDGAIEALEDAQESAKRIARIVRELAMFGRPDARRSQVRLIDVVEGALRWLPASVARTATVTVEDGGAPDVVVAVGQIEQVIVNLIANAASATPEGQRDTIIVRTGSGERGRARLEVIDHGRGIAPALQMRIFEPFFTANGGLHGQGMGLGLSICHAIVTTHGGTIAVQSEVGKGTTVRVELPTEDLAAGGLEGPGGVHLPRR